jgi:DNA polymerase elongation subunit (family B)
MEVIIYDIETFKGFFLMNALDYQTGQRHSFTVNNLQELITYIDNNQDKYWVGYNNIKFDGQIVSYIYTKVKTGYNVSTENIHEFAQTIISSQDKNWRLPYKEEELFGKQIDLFLIWHFDNKNKRISLKSLEFELRLKNVEELPFHHSKASFTKEEINQVIEYCWHDVEATKEFYEITIGKTSNPLYKDFDQIKFRQDVERRFNIPCLNYSYSRIGDEIFKKRYEEQGEKVPKKGFFRKEIRLKFCVPEIPFKTPALKKLLEKVRNKTIRMDESITDSIILNGTVYRLGKGGIHSDTKGYYEETEDTAIVYADVSSYYPAIIMSRKICPFHLNKEKFLKAYNGIYEERLQLLAEGKEPNIVESLKKALNSAVGKMNDKTSWLFDTQAFLSVTLSGQFFLLYLIESCESVEGVKCISANTDGVKFLVKKKNMEEFQKKIDEWSEKNKFKLKTTQIKKVAFKSISDYIAIQKDGGIITKGDFVIYKDLDKNGSARIVSVALCEYFINNKPVEETINSATDIHDFLIKGLSKKEYNFVHTIKTNSKVLGRVVRYYIAKEGGGKLSKVHKKTGKSIFFEEGNNNIVICNFLTGEHIIDKVDKDFYIKKTNKILSEIIKLKEKSLQLSLF